MHKLKLILALVLTGALLAAGAGLPGIVAAVLDKNRIGCVSTGTFQSVSLDIRQNVPVLGKLAMIDRMSGVIQIDSGKTRMNDKEVLAAAEQALAPYISAGLMDEFELSDVEALHPLLAQVPDAPALSGIFWTVVISGGEGKQYFLTDLAIDDETGKLLRISFTAEHWNTGLSAEDTLGLFADIYFAGLEIPDYQDFATGDLAQAYIGDKTSGIRYRFMNEDYGEIEVDLFVHGNGFYTAFHEIMGK